MKRLGARSPGLRGLGLILSLLMVAACGEGPGDGHSRGDGITVSDAWVRVAIVPDGGAGDAEDAPPVNTAAYLVLSNRTDGGDALVAVEAGVGDTAEIHSVTMDGGVMRMRPVDSVVVPAGGEAVLEPGGYHIMIIGLREPLAEDDSVELRLTLRSGRVIDVRAPVLRSPPAG